MSLNLIFGKFQAKKMKNVIILGLLLNSLNLFSQSQDTNIDTPNLSFENGNLSGWEQYTGGFYYDSATDEYKFQPWQKATNTNRISIVNGFNDSSDPVIRC